MVEVEQTFTEAVRTGVGVDSEDVSRALTEYRAARDQQLQRSKRCWTISRKGPGGSGARSERIHAM
jgi:hypothetical protein